MSVAITGTNTEKTDQLSQLAAEFRAYMKVAAVLFGIFAVPTVSLLAFLVHQTYSMAGELKAVNAKLSHIDANQTEFNKELKDLRDRVSKLEARK